METKHIIGFLIGIIVIVGGIAFVADKNAAPAVQSKYDLMAFSQCIKDAGATFYGAFWCPHCQATKRMFGDAKSNLPYVECSTTDGKGQLPICIDKKIAGYPTWIFADGTRQSGELTLEQLANATGCQINTVDGSAPYIPQVSTSTAPVATTTPAASPAATSSSPSFSPVR